MAHADRVDEHEMPAGKLAKRRAKIVRISHDVHAHAQYPCIDTQLVVAADAITVGREQGDFRCAEPNYGARCELRNGRGLADARGAYESVNASTLDHLIRVSELEHAQQAIRERRRAPVGSNGRDPSEDASSELLRKTGLQESAAVRHAALDPLRRGALA